MGGSKAPSKQTTTVEPGKTSKPYVKEAFADASAAFSTAPPQYYPGQVVAPLTAEQLAGQQALLDAAAGQGQQLATATGNATNFILDPNNLNPDSNPYLQGAVEAGLRPIYQQLQEDILPQIGSSAITAGQYGGSRQGIAEGLAIGRTQTAAADASVGAYADAYQQGIKNMLLGVNSAPAAQQALLFPGQTQLAVGGQNQQQQQLENDAAKAQFDYEQNAERYDADAYASIVQKLAGMSSTTQQSGVGASTGGLVGALGGAATGAGIVGGLTSAGMMTAATAAGPVGWSIIGASALAGLLG